jgi:hypothetical protein
MKGKSRRTCAPAAMPATLFASDEQGQGMPCLLPDTHAPTAELSTVETDPVRPFVCTLRDVDSRRRPLNPLLFDDTYARKRAYDAVIAAAKKTGS